MRRKVKTMHREVINEDGMAEVTGIEQGRVNIRSVTMKHCIENEEKHETIKRRKTPRWLQYTFKKRRRNYMIGKIYLKNYWEKIVKWRK